MANTAVTPNQTAPAATGRSNLVAGARVTGDITVPGLLELMGHIDGRVAADSVTIEEPGSINGEVTAVNVAVKGVFGGRISGGAVKLMSTARVTGEIHYDTLMIESGAEVDASFSQRRAKPVEEPAPAAPAAKGPATGTATGTASAAPAAGTAAPAPAAPAPEKSTKS